MSRRPLLIGEDLTRFVIDRDGVAVVPHYAETTESGVEERPDLRRRVLGLVEQEQVPPAVTTCTRASGSRAASIRALNSGTLDRRPPPRPASAV